MIHIGKYHTPKAQAPTPHFSSPWQRYPLIPEAGLVECQKRACLRDVCWAWWACPASRAAPNPHADGNDCQLEVPGQNYPRRVFFGPRWGARNPPPAGAAGPINEGGLGYCMWRPRRFRSAAVSFTLQMHHCCQAKVQYAYHATRIPCHPLRASIPSTFANGYYLPSAAAS